MNTDKQRWVMLAAACVINLCLGSIYAWSVFSSALVEYFAANLGLTVTSGDLSIVYTIANAVSPITMITGGWFNDRLGPKKVIALGGFMWGLGMFLSGFATSVGMLIVTYSIVGGLGLGMAYGSTVSTSVKYFPDKSGLAGGITTAAYGLSSVILPTIVVAIVNSAGVTTAFKAVGIAFVIIVVGGSFFMKQCPEGYVPKGYNPPTTASGTSAVVNKNWKQMLASPSFYLMLILMMCGAFSGMMVISQASSVSQNMVGMSVAAASTAVSVLALFNVAGRLLSGSLSDKLGRIRTLILACAISIVGMGCLYFSGEGSTVTFYIGVCCVGFSFGSFMGIYPGFTADQFGPKNNSVNYGIMFIGFALAGLFGPQTMSSIYNGTGAYQTAFLIACALGAIGIVLAIIHSRVTKHQKS